MKRFIGFAMIIIMLFVSSCTRGNDALDENGVVKDETVRSEETDGEISDTKDDEQPDKDVNAYVPEKDTTQNENKDTNTDSGKKDSNPEQETEKQEEPEVKEPEQQENESKDTSFDKPQEQPEPPEEVPDVMYNDPNATPASSFKYSIHEDDNSAIIIEFIGTEKDIIIPNCIEGCPVNRIATCAFYQSKIESVVIPENIRNIYDNAFRNNEALKTVTIKSKSLVIWFEAFRYCTALENLTLSEGVKKIEGYAFANCKSLRKVHIPSTLNDCGNNVFGGTSLEEITFADGIEAIGGGFCFAPVIGAKDIPVLKSVTIPASVKEMVWTAFGDNLLEIVFLGDAPQFDHPSKAFWGNPVIKYKKGTKGWDTPVFAEYTLVEFE